MRFRYNLLLLLFILPVTLYGQPVELLFHPAEAHYLWPTEASPYLSSTFGETRSAHFHSALDIKTWGQSGYKVFATRDGIVHRIAIGPKGYGKVIYLRHDDYSYSVYAHLQSFNSEIQHLADSLRFSEDFTFRIDRFVEYHDLRVKQGDVIGYSGSSGIGPPHLHFELRSPDHRPFNPLLTNLDVKDTVAPRIRGISVEPLSPRSRIENRNGIFTRRGWLKNGRYELGTISVEGPVGLGVDAYDQSNHVTNVYAVYELGMELNGKTLFQSRVDSFGFHETNQMFLDRVYPLLRRTGRGYQRLYVADGNTLPFYSDNGHNGTLDLEPGIHDITIRVTDFFGNTSTGVLRLRVAPSQPVHNTEEKRTGAAGKKAEGVKIPSPHDWDWFDNWFTIPEQVFRNLTVAAENDRFLNYGDHVSVDVGIPDDLYIGTPDHKIIFRRIRPDSFRYLPSADGDHFATFPASSFYDTVSVGMSVRRFSADSIRADILPDAWPLKHGYSFHVRRDSALTDTAKLSFYRLNRKRNKWNLVPTNFTEKFVVARPESLGTFVTLRDTVPPTVTNPRLIRRSDGQWLIAVTADDTLSGIDYTRSRFTVDGVRGIAEYEPEEKRILYYHPDFSPSQEMEVSLIVYDRMDNRQKNVFYLRSPETNAGR